jgi:transcriptional regulator with XRE-family HTH domain
MAEPVGGRLSEAFRQTYEAAGVSQLDIAAALDVDQPTVSKWARGMRRPPLDALPVTERLCTVTKGTILRRAGYVDDLGGGVREAVLADPDLSEDDRRTLIGFYEFALSRSATLAK